MESLQAPESERDDEEKLVPEWEATADDQVLWAGLAVVAALALVFSWQAFFGGDSDPDTDSVATQVTEQLPNGAALEELDGGQIATGLGGAAVAVQGDDAETTQETTVGSTQEPADEVELAEEPVIAPVDEAGLEAALSSLPGDVSASIAEAGDAGENASENTVTLTGFVANDQEAATAMAAAGAVDGVDTVIDELAQLEPAVGQVLNDAGVIEAEVAGEGTTVTVSGVVQSENARTETVDAASAVPGVTAVVDQLSVSVAQSLNELPTVPFATGSDQILAGGQDIIDEAAAIITAAGEVQLEVRGYTDTVGDETMNLALSSARAEAVTQALIDAGVDSTSLAAQGFGETEEFGEGQSPEALAANRVVRFEQIG